MSRSATQACRLLILRYTTARHTRSHPGFRASQAFHDALAGDGRHTVWIFQRRPWFKRSTPGLFTRLASSPPPPPFLTPSNHNIPPQVSPLFSFLAPQSTCKHNGVAPGRRAPVCAGLRVLRVSEEGRETQEEGRRREGGGNDPGISPPLPLTSHAPRISPQQHIPNGLHVLQVLQGRRRRHPRLHRECPGPGAHAQPPGPEQQHCHHHHNHQCHGPVSAADPGAGAVNR